MRVQRATAVTIYTEPFDAVPSSVSAAAVRQSTLAAISPAPTTSVVGQRVAVTLAAADHTNALDRLVVTVSATVNSQATKQEFEVDVVGSYYFTLGSLREEPNLNDINRFPDALLAEFRDEIEVFVEEACQVAFVPRWGTETQRGDGTNTLVLRTNQVRSLTSVKIDGVTQTVSDFEVLDGDIVHRRSGLSFTTWDPVVLNFEHGHDRPPAHLVREMKNACRSRLLQRGAQSPRDRVWEQTPEGLTVRFSTADVRLGRWSGMSDLDAAITMYSYPRRGFA